ncbi:hypothetical protein [Streptomyces sp. NPDC046939]|uniref:hypothetical protein n=1 Tax=Streptomyces sp. NPDC046939 TaxID=3155376 RepID=UPI0033F57F3D
MRTPAGPDNGPDAPEFTDRESLGKKFPTRNSVAFPRKYDKCGVPADLKSRTVTGM